jgi:hypothetical protein
MRFVDSTIELLRRDDISNEGAFYLENTILILFGKDLEF